MVVLSKHQQRVIGVAVIGGGAVVVGGKLLQLRIKLYQKEQSALCEINTKSATQPLSRKPKVGMLFRFQVAREGIEAMSFIRPT